jgi:hypothetical protein
MEKKSILPSVPDSVKHKPAGPLLLEKRDKGRLKLARSIRVRPSLPGSKVVEEILETLNVSRHGLYFATACSSYYKGMRLFVTYPYSSAHGAINRDYLAKVVRVNRLPNDLYGIAVQFSTTLSLEMHTRSDCF